MHPVPKDRSINKNLNQMARKPSSSQPVAAEAAAAELEVAASTTTTTTTTSNTTSRTRTRLKSPPPAPLPAPALASASLRHSYAIGRGETGVLTFEPYKSLLLPYWAFRTVPVARHSSELLWAIFRSYVRRRDFVGADMARKFIQMGMTRARRYANHKGGRKYAKNTGGGHGHGRDDDDDDDDGDNAARDVVGWGRGRGAQEAGEGGGECHFQSGVETMPGGGRVPDTEAGVGRGQENRSSSVVWGGGRKGEALGGGRGRGEVSGCRQSKVVK